MALGEANGMLGQMGLPDYDSLRSTIDGDAIAAVTHSDGTPPAVYLSAPVGDVIGMFAVNMAMGELGLAPNGDGRANGLVEGHAIEVGYREGRLEFTNHPNGLDHFYYRRLP